MEEAPTDLEASLQCELNKLLSKKEAEHFTIFRTPHNISQSKKNFFEPTIVSIGPFHRGQKHLRAMEEQKRQFLQDFLSHGNHITLNHCISEMKLLEKRTRRCYSETFDDFSSNAFVEMMLLDGCFVLEFWLNLFKNGSNPINDVGWNTTFVYHDFLLLENQIPFFIVEKLYEIGNLNLELHKTKFVKRLVFTILFEGLGKDTNSIISNHLDHRAEFPDPIDYIYSIISDPPAKIHHLVHLSYHSLVPIPDKPVVLSSKSFDLTKMFSTNRIIKGLFHRFRSSMLRGRSPHLTSESLLVQLLNSTRNIFSRYVIPSATELKQKGLKFTPQRSPKHMLDISFEYGVLKIPTLTISDSTKLIFSNLIAFEHSKYGKEQKPFTMFVVFLDKLVNTPNDVTILQECGIIENWLGSEEEVAHFINQATEFNGFERDHYLAELYMEVNRYIGSSWNRHRAKLIQDNFSNPWAIISLIAAIILLVLTFVQSFYAVYAYKFPPSS